VLFTSLAFLVFFPVVWLAFLAFPERYRAAWLLVASYAFYAYAHPAHLILLVAVTSTAYLGGRAIDHSKRRAVLTITVAVALLPLVAFKYAGFFVSLLGAARPESFVDLVLPVGISFFTFQAVSYLVDIHRGHVAAEVRPVRLALYLGFFPQLLAGPIERASNLLPQLSRLARPSPREVYLGLKKVLWGCSAR
jgi:alginate O-acetyltransferase complex protein AlgI